MNADQIGGIIRSILMAFSGFALEHGVTQDQWLAISGGVVALITVAWSLYSNSNHQIIKSAAENPDVTKVVVRTPGQALEIDHDKVVAR